MDHGFSPPFDLDSLRSKVEGRFESVGRGEFNISSEIIRSVIDEKNVCILEHYLA